MKVKISINLDMDGTIADLYAVEGWLDMLEGHNPTPYREAKPMMNMSLLSRYLRKAQAMGYDVNIVSWLSKSSNEAYDKAVIEAKLEWLKKHLLLGGYLPLLSRSDQATSQRGVFLRWRTLYFYKHHFNVWSIFNSRSKYFDGS